MAKLKCLSLTVVAVGHSYMEIYNEKLRDLFEPDQQRNSQSVMSSTSASLVVSSQKPPLRNASASSFSTSIGTHSSSTLTALTSASYSSTSTLGAAISSSSGLSGLTNSQLKIREHPSKGIYVQNLNQYCVSDLKTTLKYLQKGNMNRSTASTHIHDKSSRSHAIFTITFVQVRTGQLARREQLEAALSVSLCLKAKVENEIPIEIMSKLHLVDLAGR